MHVAQAESTRLGYGEQCDNCGGVGSIEFTLITHAREVDDVTLQFCSGACLASWT